MTGTARPSIALTGATGFVGQAVLDTALAAGYDVRALTRREQAPREGVEWVPGELADTASLSDLTRGVEATIHVAGVVNAPDAAGFEAGNVTGTLNLVETLIAKGIPRFVHVSSLSAREPELSAYGASKARAEKLLKASPLDWTIVRPPAIYGPRDKEMFELFRAARWGVIPTPSEGLVSMIHVEDLARLLIALVDGGETVSGRVFEPDDGRAKGWSHYEMARAIGWAMGRRPMVFGLSRKALERAAHVDRFFRGTKAKMTLDRAAYFSHPDWVVSPEAAVPANIWQPQIETREGLKSTAQWYRENKWL
ncbi:NAD-dependent epimerase/dehydratase family protein [Novosphingobium mangrovi (ex Huang et al. 2023)]|uniref:NAD(P)-dependent oxidoreductase n=1 Tax=Novosphingobium mangrovi (ex Huang et al. 2023) TaxID=2976432 RepID=A0ABT2I5X3_9SPHN|nr:NAD(P)-dependent oxidoreductase [Novosphingobium mangrovi (ex Huang et al. 2023)]MCT2400206.1 NAD(P)-dependent oxidoreductase [Novosphingobium mangrovi (ex Huang et al. 2023)]